MSLSPSDFLIDDENINTIKDSVYAPFIDGEVKGFGYVPRDYKECPQEMFDPPANIPLIPKSEWSARIKEMEETKSRIYDLFDFDALDQNGNGFCTTEDTEVLTEKGWIEWPKYDWNSAIGTVNPLTHTLEFQKPFEKHVYEYDGPMLYSTNRRIDFGVTPDHQMYVRKWDESQRTLSDHYSFVRAGDLGWYTGLLHAPSGQIGTELVEVEVPGDRRYSGDDFVILLALIVSDGYAGGSNNTKNWVSFASFREDMRPAIQALAARIGFREKVSSPGVWIRYNSSALAAWVREYCYEGNKTGARAKRVPPLIKHMSQRQIKLFLQWFNDRNRDGSQFYSSSKGLIDDLQELFLRIGKRSTIGINEARDIPFRNKIIHSGKGYTLTVGKEDRLCLDRKKHIETDRYKGLVYCAAVPNHTLLTRRNGSVLISSNCWAYSSTSAVMLDRKLRNQPYVRLSAHAVACIIKNFKDEGGWCGLSAKFYRERGCPSVEFWAEKSMSRQYDKPETWENAALHKITEDWVDLTKQVYDQNLTFDQLMSCLLARIPCPVDFDWWGHSVCAMDPVEVEPGSFGIRILNSWSKSWGDRGTGVLRGNKAIPMGALAVRSSTVS